MTTGAEDHDMDVKSEMIEVPSKGGTMPRR